MKKGHKRNVDKGSHGKAEGDGDTPSSGAGVDVCHRELGRPRGQTVPLTSDPRPSSLCAHIPFLNEPGDKSHSSVTTELVEMTTSYFHQSDKSNCPVQGQGDMGHLRLAKHPKRGWWVHISVPSGTHNPPSFQKPQKTRLAFRIKANPDILNGRQNSPSFDPARARAG